MSSNDRMRRRAIDAAIDRAVSDMMQIEPRPGLRRRVLSSIEGSAGRQILGSFGRKILWAPGSWQLVSAAAVLMIVVTVLASRWRDNPAEVAQTSAPPASVAISAPVAPTAPVGPAAPAGPMAADAPATRVATPGARSAVARSDALFGPRRDRVSAATVDRAAATPSTALDPLTDDTVPPSIPLIVTRPLAPLTEIRVAPLEMQLLTIPPLSPGRYQ